MMNPRLCLVAILLTSPIVIFVVHIALTRMRMTNSNQVCAALSSLLALLPMLALSWSSVLRILPTAEMFWGFFYVVAVHSGIGYAYFHLFNMSETARRIRILRELYQHGSLSREKMANLYDSENILNVRLERLTFTGQLSVSNGKYHLKGRSLYYPARLIAFWRALLIK